jgi:hypothetical protein
MGKFFDVIERLRGDASQMKSDADAYESGQWRFGTVNGDDETPGLITTLREKAAHLLHISDAYERHNE